MAVRLPQGLGWEVASVERNIFHPFVGQLLLNEDGTLATRGGMLGLRIYDDLERDARVFSVMQKRKLALCAYPWKLDAGDGANGKRAADLVERHLKGMNFIETCAGLMDAVLKGFSVGEILWAINGREIQPQKIIMRDQRRFRFDIEYQLHLLTYGDMLVGEVLPPRKFISHSYGSKDGSPYGLGLGTRLFWCVFFKRQDIGFWLAYLDKFGMPTSLGKYPSQCSPAEKAKLIEAMEAIAQETGIAIPDEMSVELMESAKAANDGYENLARYMDEQIAEIVLGETLTTNIGDVGSKAAAGVHNDVRLELTQADAELLCATLNGSLVQWIVDLNMPGAPYPLLSFGIQQPEDLSARATRDQIISSMGYKPTLDYITETYGGEWVERAPAVTPSPGAPGDAGDRTPGSGKSDDAGDQAAGAGDDAADAAFSELAMPAPPAGPGTPAPDKGTIDGFVERLGAQAQPSMEAMVTKIRSLLDDAGSLEEARDRLIDLYPDLDAQRFAEAMSLAVTAGDLAGRYATAPRAALPRVLPAPPAVPVTPRSGRG